MVSYLIKTVEFFLKLFYPLFKRVMNFTTFSYLATGAANTAFNVGLFALFYQVILPGSGFSVGGIVIPSYTVALVLAFAVTVPTGFWLSKQFAFKQKNVAADETKRQLFKYLLVVLQGLLTDYLIMLALIKWFNVYPTVAKVISTVKTLTVNYLLQRYFTFRVQKKRPVLEEPGGSATGAC